MYIDAHLLLHQASACIPFIPTLWGPRLENYNTDYSVRFRKRLFPFKFSGYCENMRDPSVLAHTFSSTTWRKKELGRAELQGYLDPVPKKGGLS